MLLQIGRRPPADPGDDTGRARGDRDDDVAALLHACHQRIRHFMDLACALPTATAGAEELRDAARACARYVADALPLHVADEEASLLPRLRGHSPEADHALALMQHEHRNHEAALRELLAALAELIDEPSQTAWRARLLPIATQLRAEFQTHLQAEEAHVFPLIDGLPAPELDAIRTEMRARRVR